MATARSLVGAITLVTVAAALAACTSETDDPGPTPTGPAPSATATEPGPLQVTVFGDARRVRTYERIAEAYQEGNPEAELELTSYPDSASALEPTLTALEAGWDPDVFLADYRDLPELVVTEALEPVDTLLEERGLQFGDDFQRAALTSFSANDRLQCMPAEVSPLVVYYNKRLARAAQPLQPVELPNAEDTSWTWEEYVTLARTIAGLDQLGPIKGAWYPPDVETLTAYLRSAGGDIVDDLFNPTSLNLTSDEALETIDALASLARDPVATPTPAELRRRDAVDRFIAGRLGMLVGTRDHLPRLRAAEKLRFNVLPLPSFGRSRSVAAMNGWCVNGGSDRVGTAADFVAFAVGAEAAGIAAASGSIVPSRLDALHDDSFTQPGQQPTNAHVYAGAIRRSEPMPFSLAWDSVAELVEESLQRLYTRPGIDQEATLERRMERLNSRSVELLAPDEAP